MPGPTFAADYDFDFVCGACGTENKQAEGERVPVQMLKTKVGTPIAEAELKETKEEGD
jgi:hypothetical protein